MRNMSFSKTICQIREQSKTVTRRFGWWGLKPGDMVQPIEKGMGLKKGEKVQKIGGPIRIISTRREMVGCVDDDDLIREGFPCMTRGEFIKLLTDNFSKATGTSDVNRIEFEYVEGGAS